MPTPKKLPAFKILIPTGSKEVEKLVGFEDLVPAYFKGISDLEWHVESWWDDDNEDTEESNWELCSVRGQLEFVLEKMQRFLDETHELHTEWLSNASTRILRDNPAPKAVSTSTAEAQAKVVKGTSARRSPITRETKDSVRKMISKGKTASEVARALGLSLPTVQNIKKTLGLAQPRRE